ncbi:MAG: glycoside hydrolase family 3 N-terminal domain-containing protein [Dehalococcoidia bacterium]
MNLRTLIQLALAVIAMSLSAKPGSSSNTAQPGSGHFVKTQCTAQGRAATLLETLSPGQLVGQLFMVGLRSGDDPAETDAAISDLHAGNVVLYGTGWEGADLIAATTAQLKSVTEDANGGVGPFISGNQEGGTNGSLQAFYGSGFSDIPSAVKQPALAGHDPTALRRLAKQWGAELLAAGINLDLAPVLDTAPPDGAAANAPIGRLGRAYGTNPGDVKAFGVAFQQGMQDAGVAVAVKHFPGLGRVTGNTDFTAEGIVDAQFSGANDPYLTPFRAAIGANPPADFVMVSSAIYSQVDSERAMFSYAIVTGILRQKLGFQGIIITDDVGAAAAVADLTPAQRALRFFHAGGDMVLTVQPSDIQPMLQATLAEMNRDPNFARHIDQSVQRVLIAKANYNLLPPFC